MIISHSPEQLQRAIDAFWLGYVVVCFAAAYRFGLSMGLIVSGGLLMALAVLTPFFP